MSLSSSERLYFLDWLRIAAFGLLVLYHTGMYYVSWPWHIKSITLSKGALTILEWAMRFSSPWRMSLLFLLSGAVTMIIFDANRSGLLRDRLRRLFWPLLVGIVLVVPPQSYFEVQQRFAYTGSYLEFLSLYFRGMTSASKHFCDSKGACLILPTWNHLWFLAYLLCYTILLWLVRRALGASIPKLNALNVGAPSSTRYRLLAFIVLVAPLVYLIVTRASMQKAFPITHDLVNDWFGHSQSLMMFALGALLTRFDAIWPIFSQARYPALVLVVLAWILREIPLPIQANEIRSLLKATFFSVQQWAAIVTTLGFAAKHWNVDHRWRTTLNDAVFPLYLFHQTLIIVLAVAIAQWRLPVALEALTIVLGTFGLAAALYGILKRLGRLGIFFGVAWRIK